MFLTIKLLGAQLEATTASQQAILAERPESDEGLALALRAWQQLSSSRPLGFGVSGLIPWTVMRAWCRVEDLDDDATDILVEALSYADIEELQQRNVKRPKAPPPRRGR